MPPRTLTRAQGAALATLAVAALTTRDARAQAPAAGADPPRREDAPRPTPSEPQSTRITPPVVVTPPRPAYPEGADGRRVDVELVITVSDTGIVVSAEVLGHIPSDATEAFDISARDAARAMRFEPARRDGRPVPVRVRYHMAIVPPAVSADGRAAAPTGETEADEIGAGSEGVAHSHGAPGRGAVAPVPSPEYPDDAPPPGVTVSTARREPVRAASDFDITPGRLGQIPRANAAALLQLAPGILLTNEGGDGHAEQVYLRGFDAREGQDLEFTVNGVPINEAGNPHGEGYADTHFIIPELVSSIRVLEGPFDPHQGNYAVAGSAEYRLGLARRGASVQYTFGSFNTHRLLALWGPEGGRPGTFAGVDLRTSDGFGANRAARHGRAMAQWELLLGGRTVLQLLATSYVTQFGTAGVIREDDYNAGRIDFFGSYDPTQGGNASRHTASISLEDASNERVLRQQLFFTMRGLRLRQNYTGFLDDPPAAYRSGVSQRGDTVDQSEAAVTAGARGSMRLRGTWRELPQAFEVGYYARHDRVDSAQRRLRTGTVVPYRVDFDFNHAITNVGLYLDAEVRPWRWLTFRGGVRGDYFNYDILNRCDLHDTTLNAANPVVDQLCYNRDRTGPRDPSARRSAGGLAIQPRGTVLVGPFRDTALEHVTFTVSGGTGARAADPSFVGDGNQAPFSSIAAVEGGAVYHRSFGRTEVTLRALYFFTRVDRDLVFNQQEGRSTLAPGTRRQGAIVAGRLTGRWFDWSFSATAADARFERGASDPGAVFFPPDSGDRVPYVPNWVLRSDAAVFGRLGGLRIAGRAVTGRAALGFTHVSPRTLLFGERGDPIFLLDASAGVRWSHFEVGIFGQNLLDRRYRLGEYNYVSEFRQDATAPSLVAARHFTAGPPLSLFVTLAVHFGPEDPDARGE